MAREIQFFHIQFAEYCTILFTFGKYIPMTMTIIPFFWQMQGIVDNHANCYIAIYIK